MSSPKISCYLVGAESLLVRCGEILLERGHDLRGVVTAEPSIADWARGKGLAVVDQKGDWGAALAGEPFDYLFSITNLSIIPARVLALPTKGAINFHDGPLPRFAGLYAPAWALMAGETSYAVTWHLMGDEVDAGDILLQRSFAVADDETSLTINTKCYEAAADSFGELADLLASGRATRTPHALDRSTYHGRGDRPEAAIVVRWDRPAAELARLARALDFGGYANPLGLPRLLVGSEAVAVVAMQALPARDASAAPGTVVALDGEGLRVATAQGDALVTRLRTLDGDALAIAELAAKHGLARGSVLPVLDAAAAESLGTINAAIARSEAFWTKRLRLAEAFELPYVSRTTGGRPRMERALRLPAAAVTGLTGGDHGRDALPAAAIAWLARLTGRRTIDVSWSDASLAARVRGTASAAALFAPTVPLHLELEGAATAADVMARTVAEIRAAREKGTYARDLMARQPSLKASALRGRRNLTVLVELVDRLDERADPAGSDLAIALLPGGECVLDFDPAALPAPSVERMAAQLESFVAALAAAPERALGELPVLSEAERRRLLEEWNATERKVDTEHCVHELIEAQAASTPDAVAVVHEETRLTYRELNARANRLARHLRGLGVKPDALVGLCVERGADMLVAMLAVHKAGGAYVPMDPAYPRDRIALMLEDAQVAVLLTQQRLLETLPATQAAVVCLDLLDLAGADAAGDANDRLAVPSSALAYVIYTSGSTGKPKGVMVEHHNVVNFFAAMDDRLGTQPGVWLAVTSLSFDISVLELLWTLSRGYTVVVYAEEDRRHTGVASRASSVSSQAHKGIEFSLFYFSADENEGKSDKYRLLMEGAKFGDRNGFTAVWTPERHFHAFGGLYPNPAVTGAAIAAVTEKVQIRAGSCVLPLHHPLRVAEEWSVVDNISKGRVGISFASGWQPNDFVLRPENYKDAKNVMLRDIETVRKLWRGESLKMTSPMGKEIEVRTLPRPVQKELPVWLTTAGNPESFEAAGKLGARILTHLLGQTVEELEGKLALYRKAWKEAGHPGEGFVSLMLHTFVGDDDDAVKAIVRGPMKAYLKTSISLIKQYAAAFPTFRKTNADGTKAELDFNALSADEMDALLEYSFERYYETSGLFGTPETCEAMVDRLKAIGVDDIACLIDFGIDSDRVLAHLYQLNVLRERTSRARAVEELPADYSIPGLIARHRVTHMQCTPSMATMLLLQDGARSALGRLDTMLVGGEAFPPSLAGQLARTVKNRVLNMYGPTETTIWSTVHQVADDGVAPPIGRPIANTKVYIVDAELRPVPAGVAGELLIGGLGVVRGYLRRPELTAERFVRDTIARSGGRLYRTGDLVRWKEDGTLEFLGRLDHQVKIRGFRIELGEIEAALVRQSGIREAVVIVREDVPGDKRLVAYVVPENGTAPAASVLRDRLKVELPEYMVPSHVVQLRDLPRTPNLKVDRKALPAPNLVEMAAPAASIPPQNELEKQIVAIWMEILKVPAVGVEDNFFDLGGHSLLAVQVHSRVRALGVRDVSITDLFRFPTVRALAGFLGEPAQADVAAKKGTDRADARRQALLRRQQALR